MANPAKAYLTVQVETTTQGQLLLMLYEACLKFLKQSKVEIEKRDYAKKGLLINRALAIIHELTESLNKEKGGEITQNLAGIYHFCTTELVQANIKLDTEKIDNVIKIIDGIRSAYEQIIPEAEGKGAKPAVAAAPKAAPPAPQAATPTPNPAAAAPVPPKQPTPMQPSAPTQQSAPTPPQAPAKQPAPAQNAGAQPGYPSAPPAGQPLRPVAPRPQVNAAKSRANNAYITAGR